MYTEKLYTGLNSKSFHSIVYNDWGPEDGNIIICVHGLTGNGHDFDYLARELIKDGHRLICVDLPGRGRSDFLPDPMDYNYNQYWQDLNALLNNISGNSVEVDWLGISLGGLLGIKLAALPGSPIKRLILNDVGPAVPQDALDFIKQVISQQYVFKSLQDLEKRLRETRGLTWGPITDEQWKHMAEHNARALGDGTLTYGYDTEIARVFETEPTGPADLWSYWKEISCPVLVLHGAQSVVLTDEILEKMRAAGPEFAYIAFEGCGHVPSLMAPNQIETIRSWLNTKQT